MRELLKRASENQAKINMYFLPKSCALSVEVTKKSDGKTNSFEFSFPKQLRFGESKNAVTRALRSTTVQNFANKKLGSVTCHKAEYTVFSGRLTELIKFLQENDFSHIKGKTPDAKLPIYVFKQ